MFIGPKITVDIKRFGNGSDKSRDFQTWTYPGSGVDSESRPRKEALIRWEYNEPLQIVLADATNPYAIDQVVIRWDGKEVFRDHVLPHNFTGTLTVPNTSHVPRQLIINRGTLKDDEDHSKCRPFRLPSAPKVDDENQESGNIEVQVYGRWVRGQPATQSSPSRSAKAVEHISYLIGTAVFHYRTSEWLRYQGYMSAARPPAIEHSIASLSRFSPYPTPSSTMVPAGPTQQSQRGALERASAIGLGTSSQSNAASSGGGPHQVRFASPLKATAPISTPIFGKSYLYTKQLAVGEVTSADEHESALLSSFSTLPTRLLKGSRGRTSPTEVTQALASTLGSNGDAVSHVRPYSVHSEVCNPDDCLLDLKRRRHARNVAQNEIESMKADRTLLELTSQQPSLRMDMEYNRVRQRLLEARVDIMRFHELPGHQSTIMSQAETHKLVMERINLTKDLLHLQGVEIELEAQQLQNKRRNELKRKSVSDEGRQTHMRTEAAAMLEGVPVMS